MPKYISNDLCRLIRDRSYTSGALSLLDKEAAACEAIFVQQRQRLREIRKERNKLVALIGKLDAEITNQIPVAPEDIRPIRSTPRFGFKHGSLTSKLVSILKGSSIPVPTRPIVAVVVSDLELPFETPDQRDIARRKVVERLRKLVKKGAVTRIHDTTDNQEGLWMWAGL